MPSKKILIIYNSVGLGHKVVAENIAQALRHHADLSVELLDILKFYEGPLTKVSTAVYQKIIKSLPGLWGFFYTNRVFQKFTLPLRVPFAALKAKKLQSLLERLKPGLVVSTHPAPTALLSYLKQKGLFTGPVVVTFSDFHFQPFWVYPNVDRYLVMTAQQKTEVCDLGFAAQKVVVTGLPVDEVFSRDFEAAAVLAEFNLSRTKPVVLVMGGSRGWGVKISDVQELVNSDLDFQTAVITGFNQGLREQLKNIAAESPSLKVFSSLSNEQVAKLFSAAKILVTKPGGLSIAQALLKNLPMILVNPLPTMEEMNEQYLLRYGIAVRAKNSQQLRAWAESLLSDKKFYSEQKQSMRRLFFPQAANQAAAAIIDILEQHD